MTYQQKIDLYADKVRVIIGPISKELGLEDINNRTAADILVLVHALQKVGNEYLDEVSDGQFKMK